MTRALTTASPTESHRPPWADCVVLQCLRCKRRTKISWELFAEAASVIYEAGDVPERLMEWRCHDGGRGCGSTVHFVDLDHRFLARIGSAAQRRDRRCHCRLCKST